MGVVYKAEDTKLERFVALKFLPRHLSQSEEEKQRFIHEAKAASALDHNNICTVYEIGETKPAPGKPGYGQMYIAMAYSEGESLKEKIERGPMAIEEAIDIATQISRGLTKAHSKEIIHRDIKPANLLITEDDVVKIVDFGLAKLAGRTMLTKEGTTLGTAAYMSPEQTQGADVDHRTDIWALGVVLYEMITGKQPFQGDYEQAVLYSIMNEDPEPITGLRTGVPMELERIVNKALKRNPAERYQHIDEMLVDMKSVSKDPTSGKDPALSKQPRKAPLTVGLFILVALLVGSGLFYWWQASSDRAGTSRVSVQRLAVLPFTNIRNDPQTDFLGFALADQIIGSLSYLKNILVRPSSSIRRYQNQTLDRQTAGADLKVDIILTGNYLKEANTIRLNVELVDVDANEMIWREPIEVEYENTFVLQDIVSEKVIDRLKLQFSQDERARMQSDVSQNPLAYEYYLRSLSYLEEAEGNRLAVNMLRQSIELDSTFAPAWDAIGRRTQLMGYWELGGEEVSNQAKDFFLKAIEINPELFNALAHLTMLYTDFGETDLAMKTARRMLEINPNSAGAMFAYGYVLRYAGMIEESITAMRTAIRMEPTNPTFRSAGWTFVQGGRYDDAIEAFHLGPTNLAVAWEGEIAIRRGQLEEARAKLSPAVASDPEGIIGLWAAGVLSALDGDYGRGIEAARQWEDANLSDGEGWFFLAGLYCINREIDKSISVLDTAVERGYFAYPHMLKCRFLDPARGTPGLDTVLEKARLKHEAFKGKFFSE
jgi:serine/threonine-protein kinase